MDYYWAGTALIAGLIFYELVFTHKENVENAVAIAKNPTIPVKDKVPTYFKDKALIDIWKDIYPAENIPGPYIKYVANNSPIFTGE